MLSFVICYSLFIYYLLALYLLLIYLISQVRTHTHILLLEDIFAQSSTYLSIHIHILFNKMPRTSRRGTPKNTQVEQADKSRSLEDWSKQPIQALRLKCNSYALVEQGSKIVLQQRLFAHFHPTTTTTTSSISNPSTSPDNNIREELAELRSLILDLHHERNNNNIPEMSINQNPANGGPVLAFNNRPVTVKRNTSRFRKRKNKSAPVGNTTTNNSCDLDTESSGTEETQETLAPMRPLTGFQGMSLTSNLLQTTHAPPAIPLKLFKQIQKGEYIDFASLLPAPHNLAAGNYFGVEVDNDANLLFKTIIPRTKIVNLQDWMCAWNIFVQATLSHNPSMHIKLFTYQKHFCNLVRKFNFESCYLYDTNQRTQIASQTNTPLPSRTVSWELINDELHNIFLRDSQLPACYKCKTTGHYASACPYQFGTQPLTYTAQANRDGFHTYKNSPAVPEPPPPHSFRSQGSSNNVQLYPSSTGRNQGTNNFCYRYNNTGKCFIQKCNFQHSCLKCHAPGHPRIKCYSTTTSSFRP